MNPVTLLQSNSISRMPAGEAASASVSCPTLEAKYTVDLSKVQQVKKIDLSKLTPGSCQFVGEANPAMAPGLAGMVEAYRNGAIKATQFNTYAFPTPEKQCAFILDSFGDPNADVGDYAEVKKLRESHDYKKMPNVGGSIDFSIYKKTAENKYEVEISDKHNNQDAQYGIFDASSHLKSGIEIMPDGNILNIDSSEESANIFFQDRSQSACIFIKGP